MRRMALCFLLAVIVIFGITGCKSEKTSPKKIKDLDFTVVEEAEIPDELKKLIEEKKKNSFKLSYSDQESLYVVAGYGSQETGGYSIQVEEMYETDNAIYMDTNLIGPNKNDDVKKAESFPYIVVKIEFIDKSIVFE